MIKRDPDGYLVEFDRLSAGLMIRDDAHYERTKMRARRFREDVAKLRAGGAGVPGLDDNTVELFIRARESWATYIEAQLAAYDAKREAPQ